ncbi:hypothetical protein [Roseibacillus persicicus]|uniref:hypothetical protein n=1 Tax=Roseibacillus persicicus TaxID=454148 RepID=UPI00280EF93F|nr:hypothetical protein [Roseibacillus persicicus]MDQ8192497.1 hypothetical protein [Roseibacillus persicicus]
MIRPDFNLQEAPRIVDDLRYEELVAMIEAIGDPDIDEDLGFYYIELIELNLPGAEVSDLIFWPQEWFQDKAMREVDMEADEIANYILSWTGKHLPGAEAVELPEIPKSKQAKRR